MLQCYVDGSGTGSPDLFVMAGYIAPAERWAEFSREWQERLDMRPPLPYFKMNEMAQSPGRLERAGWFYRVIEEYVTGAISVVIPVQDLVSEVRKAPWPKGLQIDHFENPFYYAFHSMVNGVAHEQLNWGITQPIDFIFDYETVRKFPQHWWELMKIGASPRARTVMGDRPIFRDDQKILPLQAADLWAWWVRKWALERVADGVEKLRLTWPVSRTDLLRYHATLCADDFADTFKRMLSRSTWDIIRHPERLAVFKQLWVNLSISYRYAMSV